MEAVEDYGITEREGRYDMRWPLCSSTSLARFRGYYGNRYKLHQQYVFQCKDRAFFWGEKKKVCHVLKKATTAESSRFCFMRRMLVKFWPQEKDIFAADRNLPGKVFNQ